LDARYLFLCTAEGALFTFGNGAFGQLGHGGEEHASMPRWVEALAGKKVVGASAAVQHTAVWTEAGELFTFGNEEEGRLGHRVPKQSTLRGWSRRS